MKSYTYKPVTMLTSALLERCGNACELCASNEGLSSYTVPPASGEQVEDCIAVCATCKNQIEDPDKMDANHWRCLNDSMWNPNPAVQVVAWRMLMRLRDEGWPADLLEMIYLDEETAQWAEYDQEDEKIIHRDSNGNILQAGDTVTLIKDLKVKGANFTAKRGTAVRRIALVQDDATQIEGRVEGQRIVILTQYVKKMH